MGTDTGGSIRGPAAVCGIAGLKPTYGLVSRVGVIPNCFSHDHAGPMAWTTEDVAILLQTVAGYDADDVGSAQTEIPDYRAALTGEVKGLVIGVPWRWFEEDSPLSGPTRAAFEAALDVFKGMGAEVREVVLPPIPAFDDAKRVIAMVDLFTIHSQDMRTRPELFGAALRYRIMGGALIRGEEYLQAMRARTDLARAMQAVMATVDLVMLPTNEPAGKLAPGPQAAFFQRPSFTTAFNVGGNPALSVCSGFNEAGLPFSLQVVGRLFDEATVLRAGDAYERATPWRGRRPAIVTSV
jgi:aspartyl-tRNA(Asn)/glutamyl-tRNA(Gln) amidotransferase subunit A